jgi:phage-related protein
MNSNDKPLAWLHGEIKIWRIIYRIDSDAIVIAEVFAKKANQTPKEAIAICKQRLKRYDADSQPE